MKLSRLVLLLLALTMATAALALIVSAGRAATRAVRHDSAAAPNITLAVDTTANMADEVSALNAAWDAVFAPQTGSPSPFAPFPRCHEYPCGPLTATFKLIPFRDSATLLGATANAAEMSGWLSELPLGGDGTCRDNAFDALRQAAHLGMREPTTSTFALLLADSAPWGDRAALARTINLLTRANVSANPVLSGWCPGAPLPPQVMAHLAAGTGGLPPLSLPQSYTLTLQILLADATTPHIIAQHFGGGAAFADAYTVPVDSGVEQLDILVAAVDDPCSNPFFPCPVSPLDPSQPQDISVQLRNPQGDPVLPGSEGVQLLESEGYYYLRVDRAAYPGPMTGSFSVEIEGLQSGYVMRASAASDISLTLLSPHTMPAGRSSNVVVSLLLPAVQSAAPHMPQPTEELFGAYNFATGEMLPLDLKDDGLSGDRLAGDGIYGGVWQPPAGAWQIRAYGTLDDDSAFQRVVAAPLRAQRFRIDPSAGNNVMPGDNVQIAFSLTNDETTTRTFQLDLDSQMGWVITTAIPASVTLGPGQTTQIDATVQVPAEAQHATVEQTTLTALAAGDDPLQSASATIHTTVLSDLVTYLPVALNTMPILTPPNTP